MAREARGFCECRDGGFVLRAESVGSPTSRNRDACPDRGGTDFVAAGR